MNTTRLPFAIACVCALSILTSTAHAQDNKPLSIPDPLKPWVAWVSQDLPDQRCSLFNDSWICAWPGELNVQASSNGGTFSYTVLLNSRDSITLPGNTDLWPQNIRTADGTRPTVRNEDDLPTITLPAGQHTLTGTFPWKRTPEFIKVPDDVGKVVLNIDDTPVQTPRIDPTMRLWLRDGSTQTEDDTQESDALRASVYRKIYDGVPIQITNRFQLNVSGRAREIDLGPVLLKDSIPTEVNSKLPVQVSPQGNLKVYAKPGSHTVDIKTILPQETSSLSVPKLTSDNFDPQEVWVWHPDEKTRSVEFDGLQGIDPERTTLPKEWHGATTFIASAEQTLTLRQTRRGEADPAPNVLNLNRTMWLDLDGNGYTIRDQLSGTLYQDWRLDYQTPGALGRVSQNSSNLLITTDPASSKQGVELRSSNVNLQAELRITKDLDDLSAVGWNHDVQSLSTTLHLPPGWELLGGRGIDQMHGTWIESWTLFDFFFVLMVALAFGKICGWPWAIVAALALCLSHGQGDAPRWIWIHLLATLALIRALPDGKIRKGFILYRAAALIILAVILAPYAREQVRNALHPQITQHSTFTVQNTAASDDLLVTNREKAPMAQKMEQKAKGDEGFLEEEIAYQSNAPAKPKLKKKRYRSKRDSSNLSSSFDSKNNFKQQSYGKKRIVLQQIDPNAVVQTGPGLPNWSWKSWSLRWNGPVAKDHTISLWLLSPNLGRFLTILRIALLIVMALVLIHRRDMIWSIAKPKEDEDDNNDSGDNDDTTPPTPTLWQSLVQPSKHAVLALLSFAAIAATALSFSPNATAQPSNELLENLKERLEEQQTCTERCIHVSRADIQVKDQTWTLTADLHAQRDTAWILPGPHDLLTLQEVRIDDTPTRALRRTSQGLYMVRVPKGRHSLRMTALLTRNSATIQFDAQTKPLYLTFTSTDWTADGISPTGLPDSSLQLTRTQNTATNGTQPAETGFESAEELPPFYTITRRFIIGLPWQIETTVQRTTSERPQLVKLPLLDNENVISDSPRVEDGRVLVDFPRNTGTITYLSEIPIAPTLSLTAPKDVPWTETWTVECSRIWKCSFDGLPPIQSMNTSKTFAPTYRPFPGESLKVSIVRPEGTPGQAITVDSVHYNVTPGQRLLQGKLTLSIRSSQGGWYEVTIPDKAELQSVQLDSAKKNIRPTKNLVKLPLKPGKQTYTLTWQQPWERSFIETTPTVKLSSNATNVHVVIARGENRWLLYTLGPKWGPAVLFWSHIAILLVVALLLGRLRGLPIATWEWLLVAIGMAALPTIAMLPIVLWFSTLAWRLRAPRKNPWTFNGLQFAIIGLTLITVITLYAAIHVNLISDIDMQVRGANSSNAILRWYVDRSDKTLPTASIISLPSLVWRITMLLWSLWLAARLLKWIPWGWRAFSDGGFWKPLRKPQINLPFIPQQPPQPAGGPPSLPNTHNPQPSPPSQTPPQNTTQPTPPPNDPPPKPKDE